MQALLKFVWKVVVWWCPYAIGVAFLGISGLYLLDYIDQEMLIRWAYEAFAQAEQIKLEIATGTGLGGVLALLCRFGPGWGQAYSQYRGRRQEAFFEAYDAWKKQRGNF